MCKGFFFQKTPYIKARLIIPKTLADIREGDVFFLIDTGAVKTALSFIDVIRLNLVDMLREAEVVEIEGVGGLTKVLTLKRPILLRFEDESYDFNRRSIHIEPLEELWVLPESTTSVLGRDILNRFEITYKVNEGEIMMKRDDFAEGFHLCYSEKV